MTTTTPDAVEALHAALLRSSSVDDFSSGAPAEVIKHLNDQGFTITRAEPAPKVEMPDGFKYTPVQQAVWDWWCEHQKAPPVCDDLNNLVWQLDKIKSEPASAALVALMSEAELDWQRDLETVKVSLKTIRELGDYALTDGEIEVLVQRIDRVSEYFAKKYRG